MELTLTSLEATHERLASRLRSAAPPVASLLRGSSRRDAWEHWKRWTWVRHELRTAERLLLDAERNLRTAELQVAHPEASTNALEAMLRVRYQGIIVTVADRAAIVEIDAPPNLVALTQSVTKGTGDNRRVVSVTKPLKQVNKEYGLAIMRVVRDVVASCFAAVPGLSAVTVSTFATRVHSLRGHDYRACLMSVVADRETWDLIVHERVDAESVLKNFEHRYRFDRNDELQDVTPLGRTESNPSDALDLDPAAFELHVTTLLQRMGLTAVTTGRSGDGGVDIEARDDHPVTGGRILVQCKRYSGSVGSPAVRDLLGAVTRARAMKGILISTGTFTREAVRFAEDSPITLIDGVQLRDLLLRYDLIDAAALA